MLRLKRTCFAHIKRRSHTHDVQAAQAGALQEDQCAVARPTIVRISQEMAS